MRRRDDPPPLPPADRARLVQLYREAAQAWRSSPRIRPTVERLRRVERLGRELAELVQDLGPAEREVIGADGSHLAAVAQGAAELADQADAALVDLDSRGAGRGGDRRLAGLFGAPPRVVLLLALRQAMVAAGAEPSRKRLCDVAAEVLAELGEDAAGIEDVAKALPRVLGKNRAIAPSVVPYDEPCALG